MKNNITSKLKVGACLLVLAAVFAALDLKATWLNGWPVVMAWFSMIVGWGVIISAIVDRYNPYRD